MSIIMRNSLLSEKQEKQLYRLCLKFQPSFESDEVVFLNVLDVLRRYCVHKVPNVSSLDKLTREQASEELAKLKDAYYFLPWRTVGYKWLFHTLRQKFEAYEPQILIRAFRRDISERETILFVRLMRACRKYMAAEMSRDAEAQLFDDIEPVRRAMLVG